jgi:hypothetical protein
MTRRQRRWHLFIAPAAFAIAVAVVVIARLMSSAGAQ